MRAREILWNVHVVRCDWVGGFGQCVPVRISQAENVFAKNTQKTGQRQEKNAKAQIK